MSTVRYFRWDDAGAPTLTGEVGSLTNLLRKCLVGTAGVAYGSKASAGWTEEFVGAASNIAVFKNNESEGGSGCHVKVDDNSPAAGGAREATVQVFSMMSDIGTGLDATASAYVRKSSALSSTPRKWVVVADSLTAYLFVYQTGDSNTYKAAYSTAGFGDYESFSGSSYRYFNLGRDNINAATGSYGGQFNGSSSSAFSGGNALTTFPPDGLGGAASMLICLPQYCTGSNTSNVPLGGANYPAAPVYGVAESFFQRAPVVRISNKPIGKFRGLLFPYFNIYDATPGEEFPDSGGAVLFNIQHGAGNSPTVVGGFLVDTVGPW